MQGDAVENFWDIPRDRLEKTFMVNIVGMISLAQKAVQHMPKGGSIINVSSSPIDACPSSCDLLHLFMLHVCTSWVMQKFRRESQHLFEDQLHVGLCKLLDYCSDVC